MLPPPSKNPCFGTKQNKTIFSLFLCDWYMHACTYLWLNLPVCDSVAHFFFFFFWTWTLLYLGWQLGSPQYSLISVATPRTPQYWDHSLMLPCHFYVNAGHKLRVSFLIFILKMIIIDISVCLSIIVYLGVPNNYLLCYLHNMLIQAYYISPLFPRNDIRPYMIVEVLCNLETTQASCLYPVTAYILRVKAKYSPTDWSCG